MSKTKRKIGENQMNLLLDEDFRENYLKSSTLEKEDLRADEILENLEGGKK